MHIHEFQRMMWRIYFHRDNKRGVEGTINWLLEELMELKKALELGDQEAVENEFADVMAWLSSLANLTGVNLENSVLKKYNGKCPKCGKTPCQCNFQF
ncbi:MAG: MazG nucleotide pyrophosphohydrolase domain-containing protein [Candidatus Bathyarchaeota archaeon]